MPAPDWLVARPVAHRGLHDAAAGVIENTPTAVRAAIEGNFAIEVDLQITADGEAVVHHDDALGRLTDGHGRLADMTAAELGRVPFRATSDRIITLGDLLDLVDGRVTLVLELKSHFDRDPRLARRVAQVVASYRGPVAAMSFDPRVVAELRVAAPGLLRGIVAERHYTHHEWNALTRRQKFVLGHLLHWPMSMPAFIAYGVKDLPAPAPSLARRLGIPVLTWTVRTPAHRDTAARFADQMIFEGFRP